MDKHIIYVVNKNNNIIIQVEENRTDVLKVISAKKIVIGFTREVILFNAG